MSKTLTEIYLSERQKHERNACTFVHVPKGKEAIVGFPISAYVDEIFEWSLNLGWGEDVEDEKS